MRALDKADSRSFLYGTLVLGLLLRLALLAGLSSLPPRDEAFSNHRMATWLLHGETFSPRLPPGLPYYLAGCFRFFGESPLAGRLSMLPWYAVFSFLLHRLAGDLVNRKAANLAVLAFALYPAYVWRSCEMLTDVPAAALVVAAGCLLASEARRADRRCLAALGVVLACLCLTRPACILLALLVPPFLLWKTRRLAPALLPALLCFVPVTAWILKAQHMTGRFVPINDANVIHFFLGNNPYTPLYRTWWLGSHRPGETGVPPEFTRLVAEIGGAPAERRNGLYARAALAHIASRPDLFAIRTLSRVRVFLAFDASTGTAARERLRLGRSSALALIGGDTLLYGLAVLPAIGFLVAPGMYPTGRSRSRVLVAITLACAIPHWLSISHPADHLAVLPLLSVFSAAFVDRFAGRPADLGRTLGALPIRRRLAGALALILFGAIQIEWIVVNLPGA